MTSMFSRLKKKLTRREKSPAVEPFSVDGPQDSQAAPIGTDEVEKIRQDFLVAKLEAIKSETPRKTSSSHPEPNTPATARTTPVCGQTEATPRPQRAGNGFGLAEKILAAGNSGPADFGLMSPTPSQQEGVTSSSPLIASLPIAPIKPDRQALADCVPAPVLRDILTDIVGHDIAHQRRRITQQRHNGPEN